MLDGVDLCEALGPGVVTALVKGQARATTAVHVWGDRMSPTAGSLIAAVGATDERTQIAVADCAADNGASVVVLPQPIPAVVREHYAARQLTLAALHPQVEWSQFIWLARGLLLDRSTSAIAPTSAQQELFALAEVVATILGSPVTVEDARSRVVAYSATTPQTDFARTSTIMGRAVPTDVLKRLRAKGVLKRLARENHPFLVPAEDPGFAQRLVIPLRVGGQLIGSIWAISEEDPGPDLTPPLSAACTAAALHLLRFCAEAEVAARYSVARLRAALAGEGSEGHQDGPVLTEPVRVVALQRLARTDPQTDLSVWRTFLRKKSWEDPVLVDVGDQVYAVVGERTGPGGWPWLRTSTESSSPGALGASTVITCDSELAAARAEAADALAAACQLNRSSAAHEEVWETIVLSRATAAVQSVAQSQLQRLREVDRAEGTELSGTVRAWLENWGDVNAAALALNIHPNTVRLRMKKARHVMGDPLDSPAKRFAALLLLRGPQE